MRPGQIFSENQSGPWTPEVWRVGPEALVAEAKRELWDAADSVGEVLNDPGPHGSMAGPRPSVTSERDDKIVDVERQGAAVHSSADFPNKVPPGRSQLWRETVKQIHDTQSFAIPD